MTHAQKIVDALTSGNPDQPELPLGPSTDVTQSLVRDIANAAVKKYIDARQHGKPIYDYSVHDHGIMYSDYFQGVSTYPTRWDDVYTGNGENAHEALDDALDNAATDGWDVRTVQNEFDPESPDNVQNSIRQNNPDMEDDDDAADGVYYYVSIFVRGVPETVEESAESDQAMLKRLGQVAIDAGKKKLQIGSLFRSTSHSEDFIDGCLKALAWLDKAKLNEVKQGYSDEIELYQLAGRGEAVTPNDLAVMDEFAYETLDRIMQDYCPPLTFFGSHSGNGSDIGCWPNYDLLREAENEGGGDLVVVLDPQSLDATWVKAGQSPLTNKYAAFHYDDEWEVWDIKRARLLWRY